MKKMTRLERIGTNVTLGAADVLLLALAVWSFRLGIILGVLISYFCLLAAVIPWFRIAGESRRKTAA